MTKNTLKRNDLLFSLCGLNCSLCPSFIRGNCTGCQEGSSCALICEIAPWSIEHGNIDYCFECGEYPCSKYDGIDKRDSLISHKNQLKDMQKALDHFASKGIGMIHSVSGVGFSGDLDVDLEYTKEDVMKDISSVSVALTRVYKHICEKNGWAIEE